MTDDDPYRPYHEKMIASIAGKLSGEDRNYAVLRLHSLLALEEKLRRNRTAAGPAVQP